MKKTKGFSEFATLILTLLLTQVLSLIPSWAHAQSQVATLPSTFSGKRIALVIGNNAYQRVEKLQTAVNDAKAMERELKAAGFDVQLATDVSHARMVEVVEAFSGRIKGGDQVVVFFAGHGVQITSGNYLLPVDIGIVNSESAIDSLAYKLDKLTDKLSDAKAAFSLVIVDACRDNPIKANGRSVGASRGLSGIDPPRGQMVVYSAGKGEQALDKLNAADRNPNGVFTREFVARMKKPGVRIQDLVQEVGDAVEALANSVNHKQNPAIYNQARGNFYFYGPTTLQVGGAAGTSARARSAEEIEDAYWDGIKGSSDGAVFGDYLQDYPIGRYASLAKRSVQRLRSGDRSQQFAMVVPSVGLVFNSAANSLAGTGSAIQDCAGCPDLIEIPAGNFEMGSVDGDFDEKPARTVSVGSFLLGKTEVTQAQWRVVMGSNPSLFSKCGDACPVEGVGWNDAQEYAIKLSQKTGKLYRLPSEAEWEYAARAGSTGKYSFGDADAQLVNFGWYSVNSGGTTQAVGQKRPNGFGLFDMYGNVSEWVQDVWHEGYSGAPKDGSAWMLGGDSARRVLRGGTWESKSDNLRSAYRDRSLPISQLWGTGFRIARTP